MDGYFSVITILGAFLLLRPCWLAFASRRVCLWVPTGRLLGDCMNKQCLHLVCCFLLGRETDVVWMNVRRWDDLVGLYVSGADHKHIENSECLPFLNILMGSYRIDYIKNQQIKKI